MLVIAPDEFQLSVYFVVACITGAFVLINTLFVRK